VRHAAVLTLGVASLGASIVAALLWLTPYWAVRAEATLIQIDSLGFLAPAMLYWGHWAFWRGRGPEARTRIALAAAAATSAACIILITLQARHDGLPGVDWFGVAVTALSVALAIAVNFAPGVTPAKGRVSHLHKYFHRPGRGEARGETR
jgi:hypothetical protein